MGKYFTKKLNENISYKIVQDVLNCKTQVKLKKNKKIKKFCVFNIYNSNTGLCTLFGKAFPIHSILEASNISIHIAVESSVG